MVGGTGFYLQSIVENIEFPEIPAQNKLRKELEKKSREQLFKIYKKLDKKGAEIIDRNNKRRLIRAIEVCKFTKKPFWDQRKRGKPLFDMLQIGIKLSQNELRKRVAKRVKKMIKLGLEKEVKILSEKYGFKIFPLQTIGYQEWKEYLNGEATRAEVIEKIKLHTLQFTKRQMTWFKKDNKIKWLKKYSQAEKLIKKSLKKGN